MFSQIPPAVDCAWPERPRPIDESVVLRVLQAEAEILRALLLHLIHERLLVGVDQAAHLRGHRDRRARRWD